MMKNLSEKSDVVYLKLLDLSEAKFLSIASPWKLASEEEETCMLPAQFKVHVSNTCNSVISEFFIQYY